MIKKIYISTILILISFNGFSVNSFPNYSFKYFDVKSGLKCTEVYNISQDNMGLLWLGTNNGLYQFDGLNYFEFEKNIHENKNPPLGNYRHILKHSDGKIWIASDYSGVSEYNPKSKLFKHFKPNKNDHKAIADGATYLMREDENKNIWFAHYFNGISMFNYQTKTFEFLKHIPQQANSLLSNEIYSLCCDHNGGIWIGYKNAGLSYYDFKTKSFKHFTIENQSGLSSNSIYTIVIDNQKTLWIGTNNEILCKKQTQSKFIVFKHHLLKKSYFFNAYLNKKNGLLYFTSSSGLHIINPLNQALNIYKLYPNENNNKNRCTNLFFDRNNHLWIQFNQGFCLAKEEQIKLFPYNDLMGIGEPNRLCYFETIKDDITYSVVKNKLLIKHLNGSIKEVPIKMPHNITQGDVVIYNPGKYSPFLLINVKSETLYLFHTLNHGLQEVTLLGNRQSLSEKKVYDAYADSKGNIWAIDKNYGIVRYSYLNKKWSVINPNNEKTNTDFYYYPSKFIEDKFGNIWNINPFNGVLKYEKGIEENFKIKLFEEFKTSNFNKLTTIFYSITDDQKGNIYFAGNGKQLFFYHVIYQKFYQYKREACFNDITSNMHFDKAGNLWCFNLQSIYKINFTDTQEKDVFTNEFEYRSYDWKNGFEGNYFGNNFVFETKNGDLYFDSKASLIKMNPTLWEKESKEPLTVLQKIRVNGTTFLDENTDLIQLNHLQNNLEFQFTCNSLINAQNNMFKYKLLPLENQWRFTSIFSPKAVYNNLSPGKYKFIVYSANSEGVWSKQSEQVVIQIKAHFTQTVWFKLLLIVMGLSIVLIIYFLRVNAIKKQEIIKTTFNKQIAELESKALRSQMNPHFVFNSLNSIQNYIVKNDTEASSKYLSKFAKLTRLIFDHSQQQFISLHQELSAIKTYVELEQFRFKNKFEFNIKISENIHQNDIEIPPMIIQPFIENAIWHGIMHKEQGIGNIELEIDKKNDILELTITDNGIGRIKSAELKNMSTSDHQSSGMRLTKERLDILNSNKKLEITCNMIDLYDNNHLPIGTQVKINIPIH